MTTTRELLLEHAARYPAMAPQDAAKLLYQRELGAGHLIADRAQALSRLTAEYAELAPNAAGPAFEDIGNGLARAHLAGYRALGGSPEALCRAFVCCANAPRGDRAALNTALMALQALCREGALPFEPAALDEYLAGYRAQGCPPARHSERYRSAYAPAYRVVDAAFADYHPIFERIERLLADKGRVIVAIDGMCASGKSTLGDYLASAYGANLFHMDDFFLPFERKTPVRLAEPGGNVDYERVYAEIVAQLDRPSLSYQPFDCRAQRLRAPIVVARTPVAIVEGSYSRHPALGQPYDLTVFLSIDDALQSARILTRNGEALHRRFVEEWIPLEHAYFSALSIAESSDLRFHVAADGSISPQ